MTGSEMAGTVLPTADFFDTPLGRIALDREILDCVVEVQGSYKVGKYMPGTLVPVVDEARLFDDQPEFALLLSWHIADELIPKLTQRGFRGSYIVPLPKPHIVGSVAAGR